jgi:hypothetical protein
MKIRRHFTGEIEIAIATRHAQRRALLQPPTDGVTARLLQGKFLHGTATERRIGTGPRFALLHSPLFCWRGNHVAVPLVGDDAVSLIPICANSRKRQAPRRMHYGNRGDLVAATLSSMQFGGISVVRDRLDLWNMGKPHTASRPPHETFHLVPGRREWRWCQSFGKNDGTTTILALDDAGHLAQWVCLRDSVQCSTVAPNVIGIVRAGQERFLYATYDGADLKLFYWNLFGAARLVLRNGMSRPFRCLMAGSRRRATWTGAAALEVKYGADQRAWFIATIDTNATDFRLLPVTTGAEWKIVGPVRNDGTHAIGGYSLLAIDASRRRLLVAGRSGYDTLYESTTDIASASISVDGTRVAFVDHDRQLVVLAYDRSVLLRATSGEHD